MSVKLSHERLDVYRVYLEVATLCGNILSSAALPIAAFDHLDRAIESIGINFMHANGLAFGSPQRASYLNISIASTYECAASLDVCLVKHAVENHTYATAMGKLWRIRGMLLGLKRVCEQRVREESIPYGSTTFPFMDLDLYQVALQVVRWTHDLLEEMAPKARVRHKLDTSTTGTVLNIAEGHGRSSVPDQNRFMKTAQEHACQTLLLLDLMVARNETTTSRIAEGKTMQVRVISMLHSWCVSNERRDKV